MSRPLPRQSAPDLDVALLGGTRWRLAEQRPQTFQMVVFYRGLHCPICRSQLAEFERGLDDLDRRGVALIAISMDDEARAAETRQSWRLTKLPLGYGLDETTARAWGLYLSHGIGKTSAGIEEPDLFSEPGLFLIHPDGTVFMASIQSVPFARPSLGDLLKAIDFVVAKDYPARGEVA